MDFIEKNWQYIDATATAKAVEIAQATGLWEVDDFKQNMFLFLVRRARQYRSTRSTPHTFINMVLKSAKFSLLRQVSRYKNQMIRKATDITTYE